MGSPSEATDFDAGGDGKRFRVAAAAYLTDATLYKTPDCDCCLEYAAYLEDETDISIETVEVNDLAEIKDEYSVPRDVESCHTVDIGDYFVEGHVPQEAIGKLAKEEPDILGIALPDMPLGSPGMPGEKSEDFVVYAVFDDGSYEEFVTL